MTIVPVVDIVGTNCRMLRYRLGVGKYACVYATTAPGIAVKIPTCCAIDAMCIPNASGGSVDDVGAVRGSDHVGKNSIESGGDVVVESDALVSFSPAPYIFS